MDEEKKSTFNVSDKRSFNDEGTLKKEEETKKDETKTEEKKTARERPRETPELNFSGFIFSLSTSALIYLGEMENPVSKKQEIDFDLAKQNIDILSMLEEKTKGNLSSNEHQLLESLLYDLRMKYVEKVRK